ncbi:MAG: TIM44-like domain-containing protein [Lachnospiraceae bacterium]
MKRGIIALICSLILLLTMTVSITPGLADAGNFSSDSDWGGGGGSSSWGSSSSWDDDYSSSSGGIFFGFGDIGVLIVIIVIAVVIGVTKQKKGSNKSGYAANSAANSPGLPISELLKKDPAFSEAEFLDRIGNMYVQMQNAWQNKQWEPMRALMTDNLYNQFNRQLNDLINRGYTNYIEKICVMDSSIVKYAQDEKNDILTVQLTARIIDYTVDAAGKLISGNRNMEKFLTYEWTLTRDKSAVTISKEGTQTVSCPNCGAPVDINKSAKCDYCGTIVTINSADWVISSIRGISQRSAG